MHFSGGIFGSMLVAVPQIELKTNNNLIFILRKNTCKYMIKCASNVFGFKTQMVLVPSEQPC